VAADVRWGALTTNVDELRDELAEISPDFRRLLKEYLFADPRDRAAILQRLREESGEPAYVWAVLFQVLVPTGDFLCS